MDETATERLPYLTTVYPRGLFRTVKPPRARRGYGAAVAEWTDEMTDDERRQAVIDLLEDTGNAQFAVDHVRAAIAADSAVAGRLALWARRLVGEALVQAQRVAVDRDALARLLVGGSVDLAAVGQLLARLTQRHT